MSDSLRRYRAIKEKLMQLHPHAKGRIAQRLTVLAMFISGIVGGKSTHTRQAAKKAPVGGRVASRVKRLERWYRNERVTYELCYLPFIEHLLAHLSGLPLVLSIDSSDVGRNCRALMVNLIYQKRAIPLVWVVIDRPKGHLAADVHMELLDRVQPLLPDESDIILLGDGEFDSVSLQRYLNENDWFYVCRTAKDTWVRTRDAEWLQLNECALPDTRVALEQVAFTEQAYGPVTTVVWWDAEYAEPIYLVSNIAPPDEVCYWYRRRMRIETFFSDQKSRGFQIDKSHISDPERLARVLIAACLAYIWMIYLGVYAHRHEYVSIIHRTDRCDLSLFQLGLDLLDHFLNEMLPIPVDFKLDSQFLLVP